MYCTLKIMFKNNVRNISRNAHLQWAFDLLWSSQKCLRADGRLSVTTQDSCSSSRSFSLGFCQVLVVRFQFDWSGLWSGYLQKKTNLSVILLYSHYVRRIDGDGWRSWGKSKVQKWLMAKEKVRQQGKMRERNGKFRTVLPWAPESAFACKGKQEPLVIQRSDVQSGVRQPHQQASTRAFLWELAGGKATAAGARGAAIIQTPGDKGVEEEQSGKFKTLKLSGKQGLSTGWARDAGLAGNVGSADGRREAKGWRGEVVRRFRGPLVARMGVNKKTSNVKVKLSYWKAG